MARLDDLIANLREAGGEYPPTLLDDVSTAYTEDYDMMNGKVADLESAIAELAAENTRLKGENYDLIMAGSREKGADPGNDGGDPDPDNDGDPEEETESIDDLYDEH